MKLKLVKMDNIFVDATHIKAYANKRQVNDILINDSTNRYVEALQKEINEVRSEEGKQEIDFNEAKKVTKSLTDPDCGMFHKGEKERQLAYSNQVISDENGWVLASQIFPGNLHDSQTGLETVINYKKAHEEVDMVMDSGYESVLLHELFKRVSNSYHYKDLKEEKELVDYQCLIPYKNRFKYIELHDYYVCPNEKS